MPMLPMAQRMHDKTKSDLQIFREEIVLWYSSRVDENNVYSGSLVDIFWDRHRLHLEQRIADYFEWIEREAQSVSPASLRFESVNQSVGAVVSYSRQIRNMAMDLNARWQKLPEAVDLGQWHDTDDQYITNRGAKLAGAMGLGSQALWTEKLNHLSKDNPWFFSSLLGIISIVISLTSLLIALIVFFRS